MHRAVEVEEAWDFETECSCASAVLGVLCQELVAAALDEPCWELVFLWVAGAVEKARPPPSCPTAQVPFASSSPRCTSTMLGERERRIETAGKSFL